MIITKVEFFKMLSIMSAGALSNPANGSTADIYTSQNIIQNVCNGLKHALSCEGIIINDGDVKERK